MRAARILYPVETLGPGKRAGIWTCGCGRHCPGCANPELWDSDAYGEMKPADMVQVIKAFAGKGGAVDGITITGGEPFEQAEELAELVEGLRDITEDILVYTGYRREELAAYENRVIRKLAVLVDGPYVQEENREHPLMGSANQRIHYILPRMEVLYERYLRERDGRRVVQNFRLGDGKACVGIQGRDFKARYEESRAAYMGEKGSYRRRSRAGDGGAYRSKKEQI